MRVNAIILKMYPTGEHDRLVTLYTEQAGKLTAIAKSILRPHSIQALHTDALNLIECELVEGRSLPIITGAHCKKSFSEMKRCLPSLAGGYFFAESIDRVSYEYQQDDALWNFLVSMFDELNEKKLTLDRFRSMQRKLLHILGYASESGKIENGLSPDYFFEQAANARLSSLPFLYNVIK